MSRRAYLMLAIVTLGCKLPNPAFDNDDHADTSDAGTSGVPETGSTTDEPLDTSDTSDTDEPGTTETGEHEPCAFKFRPALRLALRPGDEPCPPLLNELALLLDSESVNAELGMATGKKCLDFDCNDCPFPGYAIGTPGFEGLAQTWKILADLAPNGLCIKATVASFVGMSDGACIYEAMSIRDNTIEHGPIFIGQVGDAPLSWVANEVLAQQGPTRGNDPIATCSCASVFTTDVAGLGCCEGSGLEPSFYTLSLFGLELGPGQSGKLPGLQVPWMFHVVQSQVVPSCEDPSGAAEVSWALTRED